jgi:Transmembrane secretion effector
MPLIARDLIKGGPSTYGLLLGAFGVGAVLSALISTHLRARLTIERIVGLACFLFAGASLIAAFSATLPVTMVGTLMGGAGWVLALSTFNISVQLSVPRWVVGRSVAVYQALTFGGMALGSWLWGVVAHQYSLPLSLALAGGGLAILPALSRLLPMPSGTAEDLDLRLPASVPTLDEAVRYRGGQVIITIEYRVARTNASRFADAMRDLRQSRRRNGARRWTLTLDVADPELWVERYQYPSWLDYLRQRYRGTVADRAIWERVRAFHEGDTPPKVRRLMAQPLEAIARETPEQAGRTPATSITDPALPPEPSPATRSSTSDSPTGTPSGRTR